MTYSKRRTVPTQPLLNYIKINYKEASVETIGDILQIHKGNYTNMKTRGKIQWQHADLYATRLGTHPVNIWHNWYELTKGYND